MAARKEHHEWLITNTVYRDRVNIFCLEEGNEFHLGTLLFGGQTRKMKRYYEAVVLIREAPGMKHLLHEAKAHLPPGRVRDKIDKTLGRLKEPFVIDGVDHTKSLKQKEAG